LFGAIGHTHQTNTPAQVPRGYLSATEQPRERRYIAHHIAVISLIDTGSTPLKTNRKKAKSYT